MIQSSLDDIRSPAEWQNLDLGDSQALFEKLEECGFVELTREAPYLRNIEGMRYGSPAPPITRDPNTRTGTPFGGIHYTVKPVTKFSLTSQGDAAFIAFDAIEVPVKNGDPQSYASGAWHFFKDAEGRAPYATFKIVRIDLRTPVRRTATITGMTGEGDQRRVEYEIVRTCPAELASCQSLCRDARWAESKNFVKFDDGWRIR